MNVKKTISDSAKRSIERSFGRISNTLGEKGQGLVDELRGIFDEYETAEAEISLDDLKKTIEDVVKSYGMGEEVANSLAKMGQQIAEVKNAVNANAKLGGLSLAVKNEICGAIISSRDKAEVKNAVNAVLVKNEITGLTFNDVIDYNILDNWGDEQGFYGKLYKTPVTKFFYNEDDLTEADILAKQWAKDSESAKAVQTIATEGKTISTKYIYKKQRIANEDLDNVAASGRYNDFVGYITKELRRQWCNSVVKAMLVGDTTNASGSRINTFEVIGTKTEDDVFTTVKNPEGASIVYGDVWKTVNSIKNPDGKAITLFIDPSVLASIAEFTFASGGTTDYRGIDELKTKLGVADIRVYDLHTYSDSKIHAVALIAEDYWVNEKNEINVAYPNYEFNQQNWLFERNAGGAIHGIKSTAVLREAE